VFGVLPASLMLTDPIIPQPSVSDRFPDAYMGTYRGQSVVAKDFNATPVEGIGKLPKVGGLISNMVAQYSYVTFVQRFAREVVGWKWLRHENILPFIGVASSSLHISIVSPWMISQTITNFMKGNPEQDPLSLVGISCFVSSNTNPWCSLSMWPMAYNTCMNMGSSMGTSKG